MNTIRGYTDPISHLELTDYFPILDLAIAEDAPEGDITTESIFSEDKIISGVLNSREAGVLCGIGVLDAINDRFGKVLSMEVWMKDSELLLPGSKIAKITGSVRILLRVERILLNILQYLSGIASVTNKIVNEYPNIRILDTRKTLPGYRKLSKYAVYTGGGWNHRINLSDMAMIKDNHVQAIGSIKHAVEMIRAKHKNKKIELEIDNLNQLDEAIESQPDIILLDNFTITDTKIAVEKLRSSSSSIFIEASGGITPEKLKALSEIGDIGVSMGYLTHTTKFLDIGLDLEGF
ncbi:carboxylating nicotinate-nucleotide diphosphorylase [Leptospira sp. GIMC2001]|uniref:carboxylating nicotinate-nucleotide diphosphorylase n=1 Tax=Leptospira sp. GIMC2001 TaxID=1513297 RepID=UPI00234B3E76|nr:carboxylating nicotinate-nucleotide diphosphorylase [Leptospira sp. GIMC2001]WCL48642.1 carboxylating nicotinate-nucleotide diphosphorylase [Leptospira sp. GIMC2001]